MISTILLLYFPCHGLSSDNTVVIVPEKYLRAAT